VPVDAEQEAPLTPNDLLKGVDNLPDTPGLDAELPMEGSTRKQWRIERIPPCPGESGAKASWRKSTAEQME